MTIRPKIEINKAIEIMGKNVTLKNIKILHNNVVEYSDFIDAMISQGKNNSYAQTAWEESRGCTGLVYFNPTTGNDIGNAVLDNVLITQGMIVCKTASSDSNPVLTGKLILKGCTTIDFRGSFYAGTGYPVISLNPDVIVAEDFHVLYDPADYADPTGVISEELISAQILSRVPAGTKYFEGPCVKTVYHQIDIVTGAGGKSYPFSPVFATEGGSSPVITFTPNTGYFIKDVKVDGVSVGAVSSYTFTNVTKDHKIEVVFAAGGVTEPPQTGDNATLAGFAMLALALAAAVVVGVRKVRAR